MNKNVTRRTFFGLSTAVVGSGVLSSCGAAAPAPSPSPHTATAGAARRGRISASIEKLEREFGRRIGVVAFDPASGLRLAHRADQRFLHCSTAKVVTVSSVLAASQRTPGLLTRRLTYDAAALVPHSPVTSQHVADGMTVAQVCSAALTVSDNTAENLLLSVVGGPAAVTRYVRGLGDATTRLDRAETALNERSPAGLDTTTPAAMGKNLQRLLLGSALDAGSRARLTSWMRACTTGDRQIRAGVPAGWEVADKTGSGNHAESNDIAVVFRPHAGPIVLCVYTDTRDDDSTNGPDAIAATTRTVVTAFQ